MAKGGVERWLGGGREVVERWLDRWWRGGREVVERWLKRW